MVASYGGQRNGPAEAELIVSGDGTYGSQSVAARASRPEPRIREARWMLEELRLSLFARPLGAQGPISVQRIRKQLST
ncbi:DUF3418 domain-containing protein [Microcella humidisoli]|jgi:hypothetical protein|uniref:DUF3418 domain-containing protein n=1 Tax=Microcella humidisoli TaxID=2963406 RepID=A0ABY5FTN4_9MICO|nr:DUF3418 domain-containing protein [Microcella humidisoli]UTT61645.1 DUF3418 domain-containing protein [Microcella humidisoli]